MPGRSGAASRLLLLHQFLLIVHAVDAAPFSGFAYGAGSYGTLSTICFMFAALWCDILLVRLSLFSAYVLLVVNILLGMPSIYEWGRSSTPHTLIVGAIALNSVALVLHGMAFAQMLLDERPIRLADDTEEAVWRFFLRRCGMKRLEAQQILRLGNIQRYAAGDVIYDSAAPGSRLGLSLVIEGRVRLSVTVKDDTEAPPAATLAFAATSDAVGADGKMYERFVRSGELTGMRLLNLFGIYIGFEALETRRIVADMPVTLLTWDIEAVLKQASGSAGCAVPGYWRSFMLFTLGAEYARLQGASAHNHMVRSQLDGKLNAKGEPDVEGWELGAMCNDFTAKLTAEEAAEVKPPFKPACGNHTA